VPFVILKKLAALYLFPPLRMRLVPVNGKAQPVLQRYLRLPSQFLYLPARNTVSPVMPGPVLDRFYKLFGFIQAFNDFFCYKDVFSFVFPGYIVNFAVNPLLKDKIDAFAIILNEKPVPYILSVAVQRKRLILNGICDKKRYKLFRVLIRPIVVCTPDYVHRQFIGF